MGDALPKLEKELSPVCERDSSAAALTTKPSTLVTEGIAELPAIVGHQNEL